MKLLLNSTSPYGRFAKIALLEKGVTDLEEEIVDAWADSPSLLAASTTVRVPVLLTDEGIAISESWLIVMWLEKTRAEPTLIYGDVQQVLRRAGQAFGVIEAAVQLLVGRRIAGGSPTNTEFDEAPVGVRRRRIILAGLDALSEDPPRYAGGTPDLSVILAVIALDYVKFRYGRFSWMKSFPRLDALRAEVADRPAFVASQPRA